MLKKLAAATVGTLVISVAGNTLPAQAALLTYRFSNADNSLSGNFSFNQAAAANDQFVTVPEGLRISATYNGQTFTEAHDPLASVLTNFLGQIPSGQGLGLQFVVPDFTVNAGDFVSGNNVQSVSYSKVPEPSSMLGLSVVGLGLLGLGRKQAGKLLK